MICNGIQPPFPHTPDDSSRRPCVARAIWQVSIPSHERYACASHLHQVCEKMVEEELWPITLIPLWSGSIPEPHPVPKESHV